MRRRESVAGLFGAVVVLALLTVFAIELSGTQAKSKRDVEARVHERAVLAAALIDTLFQSVQQQVPQLARTYGGRSVTAAKLNRNRGPSAYLALLDQHGNVIAASQGFTAQARASLTASAALRLIRAGHPYGLGDLLPSRARGAIDFAVALPTRYGRRTLITGFAPRPLSTFLTADLRKIPGVRGAHNYVFDGNDTVLASTNPRFPVLHVFGASAQRNALKRPSGDVKGYYYDQVPLSNSTWRILLAAPNGALFASVSGLRKWVPWIIFIAFALVALAALGLARRTLRAADLLRVANSRLEHDALHDGLTGLPNRELFMDRVTQVLNRASREPDLGCALLFIDIDRFKLVNDGFNHTVGDQLLVELAERFERSLRPGDTVARIGGDEFTMLLDGVSDERGAVVVAERVLESLADVLKIDGHELSVTAGIGIALSSLPMNALELLRNADIAMYDAKRRGRGQYAIFDRSTHHRIVNRLELETDLRHAVEHALLPIHYQPIVELATGRIWGFEALARWPADWTEVAPAEFIPVAEDAGVIGQLGLHVARTALVALAGWRDAGLLDDSVCMSVNVSARQLEDPRLPGDIRAVVAEAGLRPEALKLEITESALMQEPVRTETIVADLCKTGAGMLLDDFGTGYSSLATLHRFPVDALKIARSFVATILADGEDSDVIVRSTIALAHGLGLRVIAEGIEHPAQLERLRSLGCEYGQGFLLSHPLSAEHVEVLLSEWNPSFAAPRDGSVTRA